jgi:type IV secretion system protein VirB4
MNLFKSMKTLKKEAQVSDVFPVTHLNSPSVFESKDGLLGSVIRVQGVSFEVESPPTLNYKAQLLHQALNLLDEHFLVYMTTHRQKAECQLNGTFESAFARTLDVRYHDRFKERPLYTNTLYLTIVLKGDTSDKKASILTWTKAAFNKKSHETRRFERATQMDKLYCAVEQIKTNLTEFLPTVLGEQDEQVGFSELLCFLSLVVNAGLSLPFKPSSSMPAIGRNVFDACTKDVLYPQGHLGHYVGRFQLLFGDCIQFQGNTENQARFAALLSLKKYPIDSTNVTLDVLLSLDCEFINTHTFAPLSRNSSLNAIEHRRGKLMSAKDKAISQQEALIELEDDLASEHVRLGLHHHTLMILADTKKELDENIRRATQRYASVSVVVVNETLNLEPAFWSQIPGNQAWITRASFITSKNFVDFCSLHNSPSNEKHHNHLKGAVTLLETPLKTPVHFNYHAKGSNTNPSNGHTAIFAGSDAGKTTLVNFLDAQMGRFNGRSFYLDRNQSSRIYILASENSCYLTISPKNPVMMNPFSLPDTPENRVFLTTWMSSLLLEDNETSLDASVLKTVNECVAYAYEQLSFENRTLRNVCRYLPLDFPKRDALDQWLKSDGRQADGALYWLFDNDVDALSFDFDKVGFDVTFLMDKLKDHQSAPVFMYLVHRMEQALDGRLTSIIIEEAWQVLRSRFWIELLQRWLPTIRKANGHFIFLTQSPKTLVQSPVVRTILDNIHTLITFPNANADRETYIDQLSLTETQFEFIKETSTHSRLFLCKQDQEARVCRLDLSAVPDLVRVLSANEASNDLLDELILDVSAVPKVWLPLFLERSSL